MAGPVYAVCAAFVLATASNVAAQKITEERISELIREAASRAGVTQTTATTPASAQAAAGQGDRPVVALTLDDAIKLALDRNLDISVQRLNPQTFDFSLASLRAVYRPTLTSNVSQQSQTQPVHVDDFGRGGRHRHRQRDHDLQRRPLAEPAVGRRQLRCHAQQQQADDDQRDRAGQPGLQRQLVGDCTRSRCCATSGSTTRGSSSSSPS